MSFPYAVGTRVMFRSDTYMEDVPVCFGVLEEIGATEFVVYWSSAGMRIAFPMRLAWNLVSEADTIRRVYGPSH